MRMLYKNRQTDGKTKGLPNEQISLHNDIPETIVALPA